MKLAFLAFAAAAALSADDLILESGPYRIHFEEKSFYCSAQYFYDGTEIGGRNGFYGTILSTTGPNRFIGAGHKEGGCEQLLSLHILVDGKAETPGNRLYRGKDLRMEKVSMLGNLKTTVQYFITPEQIVIRKHYEALDDQEIYSFYIFQFCWSSRNDFWMAGRPDGSRLEGKFLSNEGWFLCRKQHEPEILWVAQYNSAAEKGIIGYFSKYFRNQGSYMLWDRKVYHKFYFNARTPKPARKGYRSPDYELILKGFASGSAEWREKVCQETALLRKQYPPPAPPGVQTPEEGRDLTVYGKGKEKFHCIRIPLELMPGKEYLFSFRIAKGPATSPKATDNQVLIGQHNRTTGKFELIRGFATRIARDGKFHEVRETFRAPAEIVDPEVYVYNINSTDVVRIQEMKLLRKDQQ